MPDVTIEVSFSCKLDRIIEGNWFDIKSFVYTTIIMVSLYLVDAVF